MNLCLPCLHLISSFSSTNHRRCSYLTSPTPNNSHLPNPKPYSRVLLSASHSQRTTPTTSTTTTTRKPVAIYLTERLGFTEEQSLTISKKLLRLRDYPRPKKVNDLISFQNADNVITFLHQHCGLDHSHIKKLVSKYPIVLGANVDKTLRPKVNLLQHLGFTSSDLAHVLSTNPRLYLKSDLGPAVQALRGILGSDDKAVVRVFNKLFRGTASNITNNLIPNVTMLENEFGIARDKVLAFLTKTPQSILVRNPEWLRDVLVRMEDKWGISRDSTQFLRALRVFCCLSDENINSKCQVFRSYGWSDSDILSLIRRFPASIELSEAKIKKNLDFYMNELGYEPAYMLSQLSLFTLSLENRVVPRYRVLSILKGKGLIKAEFQFYSAIRVNETQFLDRFILPFMNVVPKLHEVYRNSGPPTEELLHSETSENECSTQVVVD